MSGLLLLWNDVDDRRRAEYDCWHTIEHVPERTWVPGFVQSRRYARTDGPGAHYFTAYELQSLDCLVSPAYEQLVREPTRWSAAMRPSLRNFLRRTYDLCATQGPVRGACTTVRRVVFAPGTLRAMTPTRGDELAQALLAHGAPACASRVCIGRQRASGPQALANVDEAPPGEEYVFLLESSRPLANADGLFRQALEPLLPQPAWSFTAAYGLLSSVSHAEVQAPKRPAPRDDLAARLW